MKKSIEKYRKIVGDKNIEELTNEASSLSEKHVVHVNSTYYGGGVAEILESIIALMNDLGIETGWRLIKGSPDFFSVTKKFHDALQGTGIHMTNIKKRVYEETNELNSTFTHIDGHDCVFVHDPQPLPLINCYKKTKPWIWRCHIDISKPNPLVWSYLKQFINKYDHMVVSMRKFKQKDIPLPVSVVKPSIDPLDYKNKELLQPRIDKTLLKFGIEQKKPIISQISRFDKWKDPIGVIKAFKVIRKKFDCQLVLLGTMATDDPEGQKTYECVMKYAGDNKDIKIINYESDILVNALQRVSSVVLQKSIKEGFALTVSEALWKKTPVVGGKVGGIVSQIVDGKNGYLVSDYKECAAKTLKLLKNPKLAEEFGEFGHNYVKENFLVTRQLGDYLRLLKKVLLEKKK